ncbi:hypothetical protein AB0I28_08320 [Phytomonospora sp. NPDC050363]|uniref:tetratricopeptide repeat protein n=1 Tax=Phytomonospora sp. NPDC050363 TaxID=3155642 RepID=UPI00340FB3E2
MTSDIWAWVHDTHRELVEAGHHRLADAVAEISGHAVNGRPDEVDAIFPEALATARALELPWVEVFLRHWRLQSLVNERQQGAKALPEATALLEFAHREETRDCPQSVCVVQDFCIAHARIDGPGYVNERIAILDETLGRIEPARNCFDCLTREYSYALNDDGRTEEALAYIVEAEGRHRAAGGDPSLYMHIQRARLLGQLDRAQEGLDVLERSEAARRNGPYALDEDDLRELALARAELYARLGDTENALAQLPEIAEPIEHADLRLKWAQTAERLVSLNALDNVPRLGTALASWAAYLDDVGSHRASLNMLLIAGRLAVQRGARTVAQSLGEFAARKFDDLRRKDTATGRDFIAMRRDAEALPAPELPVDVEHLPGYLEALGVAAEDGSYQPADPERNLDLLTVAHEREPEDPQVLALVAQYLSVLGLPWKAARILWERVEADPGNDDRNRLLANVLTRGRDAEGIARLASLVAPRDPAQAHWYRASWAAEQGEWAEAARECEALVAVDDSVVNARRMWATAARELGDFETAQRVWTEVLERTDDEAESPVHHTQPADRWSLIIAATVNGDWAAVRGQCAEIGIDLDTPEGPIDERWHPVELRYDRPDGRVVVLAIRTGPATARVESVTRPGAPLNHGDLVVIDPAALEPPPEKEEDRDGWYPAVAAVRLLAPGGFRTYFVDGAHPGPEAFEAFLDALREQGYGVWLYTDEDYQIFPPDAEDTVTGVYTGVAVPPTASAAQAHRLLTELTKDWEHPMSWLSLAVDAELDADHHAKVAQDYDL